MLVKKSVKVGSGELSIETGRIAKQASGSVVVRYGDTMVLVTAQAASREDPARDFLPLTVEYREKFYAAGKIPGGFFKREARPSEKEVLSCRIIDRPVRPLITKGWSRETQVIATVLSSDQENDSDVLALIGASAALGLSSIPFAGPIGSVRIARHNGEFVVFPNFAVREEADLELVVVGTRDSIVMVEGGGREVPEDVIVAALEKAFEELQKIIDIQEEILTAGTAREKTEFAPQAPPAELVDTVNGAVGDRMREAVRIVGKQERGEAVSAIRDDVVAQLEEGYPESERPIRQLIAEREKELMRRMVIDESRRADGRGLKDIRPITCEAGVLPRTHGSGLFTRGETQALVVTTLGTSTDEQKIDALEGASWKSYMLHYNFPPYSVGEVRRIGTTSRREVGHGALAERALEPVIPAEENFPYTLRVVSEITESNGSSSMATVCGGSLAMMDAGVPIKSAVAGIAMGLIGEGEKYVVLSDILGVEDHLGDMDFKVAGTAEGITALQMDNKLGGIPFSVLAEALEQARDGRLHILGKMSEALAAPREELSEFAPRILMLQVAPDRIRDIIGPGGKTIRKICADTGAQVDVDDSGEVKIASVDAEAGKAAYEMVQALVTDPELNAVYTGKVRRVESFGAFVEILPGKDGMVHISELDRERVERVEDVAKEGDMLTVKVIDIDRDGRVRLSRKAVLMEEAGEEYVPSPRGGRGRGDGDRGPRRGGGDRGGRDRGRRSSAGARR